MFGCENRTRFNTASLSFNEMVTGSAMATVTNEQVEGDEEDMCEDSGPTNICGDVRLSPEGRFIKGDILVLFHKGGFNKSFSSDFGLYQVLREISGT